MALFEKGKKEDDIKHVLDVLSINIESINKRLSSNLKEEFPEEVMDTINKILNMQKYLYSYLNFSQEESKKILMNQEQQNKKIDELKKQINLIAENKYLDERFDYLEERFTSVLALLKEENKILKDQNVILQKLTK